MGIMHDWSRTVVFWFVLGCIFAPIYLLALLCSVVKICRDRKRIKQKRKLRLEGGLEADDAQDNAKQQRPKFEIITDEERARQFRPVIKDGTPVDNNGTKNGVNRTGSSCVDPDDVSDLANGYGSEIITDKESASRFRAVKSVNGSSADNKSKQNGILKGTTGNSRVDPDDMTNLANGHTHVTIESYQFEKPQQTQQYNTYSYAASDSSNNNKHNSTDSGPQHRHNTAVDVGRDHGQLDQHDQHDRRTHNHLNQSVYGGQANLVVVSSSSPSDAHEPEARLDAAVEATGIDVSGVGLGAYPSPPSEAGLSPSGQAHTDTEIVCRIASKPPPQALPEVDDAYHYHHHHRDAHPSSTSGKEQIHQLQQLQQYLQEEEQLQHHAQLNEGGGGGGGDRGRRPSLGVSSLSHADRNLSGGGISNGLISSSWTGDYDPVGGNQSIRSRRISCGVIQGEEEKAVRDEAYRMDRLRSKSEEDVGLDNSENKLSIYEQGKENHAFERSTENTRM